MALEGFLKGFAETMSGQVLGDMKREEDRKDQLQYQQYRSGQAKLDRDLRTYLANRQLQMQQQERGDRLAAGGRQREAARSAAKIAQDQFEKELTLDRDKLGETARHNKALEAIKKLAEDNENKMPIEKRQALINNLKEIDYRSSVEDVEPLELETLSNQRNTTLEQLGFSGEEIQSLSREGSGKLAVLQNVAKMINNTTDNETDASSILNNITEKQIADSVGGKTRGQSTEDGVVDTLEEPINQQKIDTSKIDFKNTSDFKLQKLAQQSGLKEAEEELIRRKLIYVNPKTGARIIFRNNKWQPF